MISRLLATGALLVASLAVSTTAHGADWAQFRGPNRDGISPETGLLKEWPKTGPKLLWKGTKLGEGFGAPTVSGGKVFGLGTRDGKDGVWALSEGNGKELWFTPIDTPRSPNQNNGASGSPTVDGGKVYAVSSKGKLACLDAATGKQQWQVDFVKDFGGSVPRWGYTESPLIDGDKLICTPGGKNTLVALEKATGKVIWKAAVPSGNGAQYSSPIAVEIGGQRQYVQFISGGVVSVGASDGEFLWKYSNPANGTANCSMPVVLESEVFAASAYGTGGGLVKISKDGAKFDAKQVYFDKRMENHHGGMVLVDGYLYGHGGNRLRCIDFKTGKVAWEEQRPGKGSVTFADGHLYFRNEGRPGTLYLIEANPKEYVEKGRFDQPERSGKSAWAYPVIANGKMFIRDQDKLFVYDVKAAGN